MKGRNSNYRKGRAYELEISDLFEREGYNITLATNSKGTYDLVATKISGGDIYKTYMVVLMQCKVRKSRAKVKT